MHFELTDELLSSQVFFFQARLYDLQLHAQHKSVVFFILVILVIIFQKCLRRREMLSQVTGAKEGTLNVFSLSAVNVNLYDPGQDLS